MSLKMWIVMLTVLAFLGCSEKTQQRVEDSSKAVIADVKEGAVEAVEVTKEAAADAEQTASVKSALIASDKVETAAINVDTLNGQVHLRGYVPTLGQRTLAEEIAKNTVKERTSVINELAVGAVPDNPSGTPTPGPLGPPGTISDEAHEGHDH